MHTPLHKRRAGARGRTMIRAALFGLAVLISFTAGATHFRGGSLAWQPAGGNDVKFTLNSSWRRGFNWPSGNGATWSGPNPTTVGQTINIGTMYFGDGTTKAIVATVNSIDAAGDVVNTTWEWTKSYSGAGTFVANAFNTGSRVCPNVTISPTCNGSNFNLQTIVTPGSSNRPPVSTFPTVINVPINASAATFKVLATDPDGDSITFRLAKTGLPTNLTSDVSHESGLTVQSPPGFTLSPDGTITMNTIGRTVDSQYSFELMVEDHISTTTSPVKSKTPVDFLIKMVPQSAPPVFTSPTTTSYTVPIGTNLSFTVTAATPADPLRTVTLKPVPVPLGSTMTPSLPVSGTTGNPVSSVFNWTPNSNQTGTYVITFVAQNELGLQSFKGVSITVPCALNATANITKSTCAGQSNGAINITPVNFSTASNLSFSWTGPNSFSASTEDISGLAGGDYTVRITDAGTGCVSDVTFTVGNTLTITPTASNNGPICEGGTLSLSGSGASYLSWSGPNGFSSTSAAPSITNVTPAASGTYTLTATDATTGCSATATTTAVVNANPAPPIVTPSGPTTFCSGNSVILTTNGSPRTTSALISGGSNAPTTCDCPAGYVAVGYTGRTGSWMDRFQIACKQLNADGTLGSTVVYTAPNGTSAGGVANGPYLFTGTDALVGLNASAWNDNAYGNNIQGITGYGQTTAYINGNGVNNSGYTTLGTMTGGGRAPYGNSYNLGTLFVPNGNVVTGMVSYSSGYSQGVALRYMPVADVNGGNLSWSNSGTGNSITVTTSGTYTVTITDANGCTATSAPTTVTVNTVPVIVCPADVSVNTDAGLCLANVTYPAATATGSPAPASITYSQASGTNFNVGTTPVTASTSNVCGSVSCTFNVTVTDNQAPAVVTQNVTLYLDASGQASISAAQVNNGSSDACGIASYALSKTSFNCSNLGSNSVTLTVTDIHNNAADGSAMITVVDNLNPAVTAPAPATTTTSSNTPGDCAANVTVGNATTSDNCAVSKLTWALTGATVDNSPATGINQVGTHIFNTGTTTITYTASDASGNTATASTIVTVTDDENPVLMAPAAIAVNADPGKCYATVASRGTPIATDNCGVQPITNNAPANNQYSVGINTVTYTVYDNNGNSVTATQTITVTDNQNPVIAAPANVSVNTNPGQCSATGVNLGTPTVSDNCGVLSVTNNAPSVFPKGNTTVTYTVTDVNGHTATAMQTVTVTDNELPMITAPANVTTTTSHDGTGNCTTTYNIGFPTVSDNCGIFSIAAAVNGFLISPTSYNFPIGTTTVRWEILDNSFNFAFVNQTVTVTDDEKPTLSNVPANVTVSCNAVTAPGAPMAADNCTASPTVNYLGQMSTQGSNPAAASYYNYTITRTWDAVDASGNHSLVGTQVITVQDVTAPTFTRPANITIYKTATCSYDASPAVTGDVTNEMDNCQAGLQATYTDVASMVCIGNLTITRTWHLIDASGNAAADQVQTITIKDNIPPTFTRPADKTIYTNATCGYDASPVNTGDVTNEADNCSTGLQATYTDAPVANGACPGSKVITRTWHLVDDCGTAAADQVQTITIKDNTAPTFTAPPAKTIYAGLACSYNADPSVTGDVTNEADNCSTGLQATYTDAVVSNATTGAKTITRTWKLTDNCNNAAANQTQTITVLDNTPPTLACTGNITACDNFSGNSKTITLGVTDNCTATTTTWTMTGASVATGTGNSITKSFNVGTSTILWTVKDGANNTSTCTTTVLIRTAPVASISSSNADAFCNAVELTGSGTPSGTYSYAWTYNSAAFASTQTIRLKVANGDGNYTLVVTDGNACVSQPVSYNLQKQTLAAMYVLIGMREVELAQSNDVFNGSVGVTSSYGEAEFDKYCTVASTGAFVKAYDIDVNTPVTIPTRISSPAVVTFPTMLLNTASTSGLSSYTMTTSGTVTGNKKDLTINSGKTVTVTGNIFEDVHIGHDAIVTFTASDISMESLEMDYGAKIIFSGNTNLRVKDEVDIDKGCTVNPTGKKVTFYVKDASSSSHNHNCYSSWSSWHSGNHTDEKFIVDGRNTNIIANVYMPGGKLRVHGNGYSCSWGSNDACNMTGLFIAEEIEGDGKNINWSSYDCAMPPSCRMAAPSVIAQVEEAADYKVLVYPNPTTGQFTVQFAQAADAELRITDIQGRLISQRSITTDQMPSTTIDISSQAAGVYMIEIVQGGYTQRLRMVKQ